MRWEAYRDRNEGLDWTKLTRYYVVMHLVIMQMTLSCSHARLEMLVSDEARIVRSHRWHWNLFISTYGGKIDKRTTGRYP